MSVDSTDSLELLRAVLVIAAADGKVTGHELSLLKALAQRAGVGRTSLEAMIQTAQEDKIEHDKLFARAVADPERAVQTLVAAARIDGEVSDEERKILVDIACMLGVSVDRFRELYESGLAAADRIRRTREQGGGSSA